MTAPSNNGSLGLSKAGWIVNDIGWDWRQWLIRNCSCLLLFLCMAFPTIPQLVILKASLLAVVLFTIVWDYVISGRPRLHGGIAFWTLSLAVTGFFFIVRGMLAGNLGASAVIAVYVLWPIAFTVWIAGLGRQRTISEIHRTVIGATLFVGLYGCLYLLTQLNILPDIGLASALSFGWEVEAFGAHEGYTQMSIAGLNSFPFLVPYVMASIAIHSSTGGSRSFWQRISWGACLVGWFTVLAAGRRALFLIVLLSPVLILTIRMFQPASERMSNRRSIARFATTSVIVIIILGLALSSIYEFDIHRVWDNLATSVDLSAQTADPHATERRQQVIALSRGWLEKPVFGAGLGASALGSIRSETTPWAYELSYLALLFQTGLVGFTAYTAGILWIFIKGIRIVRQGGESGRTMLPMLVGFCGLLIANATNPYLLKFDGMWMFFLPLAVINYRLATHSGLGHFERPVLSLP